MNPIVLAVRVETMSKNFINQFLRLILIIGIFFILGAFYGQKANAQSSPNVITPDGIVTLKTDQNLKGNNNGNIAFGYSFGTYPIPVQSGNTAQGGYIGPIDTWLETNTALEVLDENTLRYNLEANEGTLGDGEYWLNLVLNSTTTDIWFVFTRENGVWSSDFIPTSNPNFSFNQTRMNNIVISGNRNNVNFNVGYFIDLVGLNVENRPDSIRVRFIGENQTGNFFERSSFILPLNAGNATTTLIMQTAVPNNATYRGTARFVNITTGDLSYPFIFFTFTVAGNNVTSFSFETFTRDQWEGAIEVTQQPCSITNFTGCIINAFTYLFIPNANTLESFLQLYTRLETVIPFGYVIQVIELRGNMSIASSTVTVNTSPFQNQIFTPIRNGLIAVFWVLFLFYLYNRFKKLEF